MTLEELLEKYPFHRVYATEEPHPECPSCAGVGEYTEFNGNESICFCTYTHGFQFETRKIVKFTQK